jgi:hypothetical protein
MLPNSFGAEAVKARKNRSTPPASSVVGSLRWRGDATSIVQAQDYIEKGCSFRTRS